MRNLFVCHSQAHLIYASGMSSLRYEGDSNHLVLFRDFDIKPELAENLKQCFQSTLFLDGIFPSSNKEFLSRVQWFIKDSIRIKHHITESFDRVFVVCDSLYPVLYCIKRCLRFNPNCEVNWLSDGILPYFLNKDSHTGLGKNSLTRRFRRYIFSCCLGLGPLYSFDFPAMGGLSIIKKAFVLYPDAVREPYRSLRSLEQISQEEFVRGISSLYEAVETQMLRKSVLLVMDKLSTYSYPDLVKDVIRQINRRCIHDGMDLYYKLHPREEETWEVFSSGIIVDRIVSAESVYLSCINQRDNLIVLGFKSAGLMTAKKMGFSTFSLFDLIGETNQELVSFFDKIGVESYSL